VEALRQKLSEHQKLELPPVEPLAASVDALSASERGGVPTFSTFKFGYLPARGMLYSTIAHELALFALFLLYTYGFPEMRAQKLVAQNTQDHVIYLPEVGGGTEGEKSPGGGESAPTQPSAAPSRASKGFAYPGRQAILSNPPNPTNAFQTIQRPLLVHPEPVHQLIPLPNIVQYAETRLPSDLIAPKATALQPRLAQQPIRVKRDSSTHRDAKWEVPVNDAPELVAKAEMPKLPAAELPVPLAPRIQPQRQENEQNEVEKPSPKPIKVATEKRAEKADKQAAPPSPAQVARLEMHGKALEPILSLSPMPLPPGSNVKIPEGEARGKFAIAPGGTLNPNSLTPGKTNGTPSITPATGQEGSHGPNAADEVASNAGTGAGHGAVAGGGSGNSREATGAGSSGTGLGSGNTAGSGAGGEGSGRGRGAAGKGAGSSPGRGSGTGSGAGSGSGSGAFPGITIQSSENAQASNANSSFFTVEPQTAYGMTVVSTAASGGGLEDFGVFHDERVYTVYIPMRRSEQEADPTWTLQYALIKDQSVPSGQVVPPAAATREWPEIPAALEKKYAQRQVVIYAVVDKEGKVDDITVKRTPDHRVSDPIVQALSKWVFRPAQVNGAPVSVKVLFGIPLS